MIDLNGSDPATWIVGREDEDIDGVLIITGAKKGDIEKALSGTLGDPAASGYRDVHIMRGNVRPEGGGAGSTSVFWMASRNQAFADGSTQPFERDGSMPHKTQNSVYLTNESPESVSTCN